jgi:Tfp pilus assembly protein PilF
LNFNKLQKYFPFLLLILIGATYWNSLFNGFVWLDQTEIIEKLLIIEDWSSFLKVLIFDDHNYPGYHRPLYNLMHSLDYAIWSENAFGYHLSSLILHLANVYLFYVVLNWFTKNKWYALVSAAVFGLLPCHTATVALIHSKGDLLACFFMLLLIYSFQKIRNKKELRVRWWKVILISLLFFLALLSKEVVIMLPFLGFLLFIIYRKSKEMYTVDNFTIYPLMIIGITFFVLRIFNNSIESNSDALLFIDRLLSFLPVYVNYILLTISGIELTTNDAVEIWSAMPWWKYTMYVLGFVGLLLIQFLLSQKHWMIAIGLLWYNIFLIPVAQIFPILHFRADRFLYIPSLGFVAAIVYFFFYLSEKRNWTKYNNMALVVLFSYLGYASYRIWDRNHDFSDDKTLFGKLIESHPECREAQGFVANYYLLEKDYQRGLIHALKSVEKQKGYYSFSDYKSNYGNLAILHMRLDDFTKAYNILKELSLQDRVHPETLFNLGVCTKRLGKFDEARSLFESYIEIYPDNLDALFNLGQVGLELRDKKLIKTSFSRYLEMNPNSPYKNEILKTLESN